MKASVDVHKHFHSSFFSFFFSVQLALDIPLCMLQPWSSLMVLYHKAFFN